MFDKMPFSKQVLVVYEVTVVLVVYGLVVALIHQFLGLPLPRD